MYVVKDKTASGEGEGSGEGSAGGGLEKQSGGPDFRADGGAADERDRRRLRRGSRVTANLDEIRFASPLIRDRLLRVFPRRMVSAAAASGLIGRSHTCLAPNPGFKAACLLSAGKYKAAIDRHDGTI